jgi:transposase-like protein
MPQPNKRKAKQLASEQDGIGKRRKISKPREERLKKVPKEDSLPIDAIVVPDTISSLHGKKRTPIATAIAEAATNTALPDAAMSLPPADVEVDVDDDANANESTDSMTDTQSNNHPRTTDPSTSTSTQEIKLEPVVKIETAPVPANTSSTDQAEAPIPMEPVINGPNLNRTVTVRRKVAKRTDSLYIAPPPPNIAAPLSPTPPAEEILVKQEPRVEEPLPATTDDAARKTTLPDLSEDLPTPDTPPSSTATVDVSTRRRSRRQIQLPPTEMSEAQPDDTDDDADYVDDDDDLSGPTLPPDATVNTNAPTRRRSSRRVIPTSSTATPIPPPSTATVNVPSAWEDRLSELAEYRKIHGHCNVPRSYSENVKLANWVSTQKKHYKLHLEGKPSQITLPRIQKLESLGFEWDSRSANWEGSLSELADYRKIHGHCNVPNRYSENTKLGQWVMHQRRNYRLHLEGKKSHLTTLRIQALKSMGFEWDDGRVAVWDDRLSELADFRKIHGHCNVPTSRYCENTKLSVWVKEQRVNYRLHLEGKKSTMMTALRIQALKSLGFEWDCGRGAVWDDRLSELADFRKIHGHCNVPQKYSENTKLGIWVSKQRAQYKLDREGKTSRMTPFRIQALKSLGFE